LFSSFSNGNKLGSVSLTVSKIATAVMAAIFPQDDGSSSESAPASAQTIDNRGSTDWWTVLEPAEVVLAVNSGKPQRPAEDVTREVLAVRVLRDDTGKLLEDCRPELRGVSGILERLRQFRQALPGRYSVSFVSLSLSAILCPLIQFELANTDMLNDGLEQLELEKMNWYQPVLDYTLTAKEDIHISGITNLNNKESTYDVSANTEALNSDDNLLPSLVNAAVFTFLQHTVRSSFDIYCTEHCVRLKHWILLMMDFDLSDEKVSGLLQMIVTQFDDEVKLIPLPHMRSSGENGREREDQFLVGQLMKRVRLTRNANILRQLLAPRVHFSLVSSLLLSPSCIRAYTQLLSASNLRVRMFQRHPLLCLIAAVVLCSIVSSSYSPYELACYLSCSTK
jgi:hypothetical protein